MAVRDTTRPMTSLFTDLVGEVTTLFQTEIRMVRAEVNEKLSRIANSGVLIAAGAIIMIPAAFVLLLAIVRWLAVAGVPEQWGLLIVGLATAGIGAVLVMQGTKNLKASAIVPQRTIDQLQADVAVVKEHVR